MFAHVCWKHVPEVFNLRLRRAGLAGYVVYLPRTGRYLGYSRTLHRTGVGAATASEAYEGLKRHRALRANMTDLRDEYRKP
jgi:hypothetical protein